MLFYYEFQCSPYGNGKKTLKLNGNLLYFAALTTSIGTKGNTWERAKALINKYIKGVTSVGRITDVTRLFTFLALNKEFGVNQMLVFKQPHVNNCYITYRYGDPAAGFHFFGVCEKAHGLPRVVEAMRHAPLIANRHTAYASVYDPITNLLTILDPPSESSARVDFGTLEESAQLFRERVSSDFNSFGDLKYVASFGGEDFTVTDLTELHLRVGLSVNYMAGSTQEACTDRLLISNGFYIEQM